jgi:acyl-CoA hydrolase
MKVSRMSLIATRQFTGLHSIGLASSRSNQGLGDLRETVSPLQNNVLANRLLESSAPMQFSGRTKKTASSTKEVLKVPAYPSYLNELGHVKAGDMLKLIDIAGSIPAKKHLGSNNVVVTASVDRTNFINPIKRWEMIQLESRMTKAWNTSMETQVNVSAWNFQTGETRPIATAHLVFVALDKQHQKTQAPELVPVSLEDFRLAQAAELRKANRAKEGKETPSNPINLIADNPIVLERAMTPNDSNALNNVFGGVILEFMDEAGSKAAQRQNNGKPVIGVRLDRMSFLQPCLIGETLKAKAVLTKTWNTSMEVKVELEALNPKTGQIRQVANCYVVYVGLGPDGKPTQIPAWTPSTPAQEQRGKDAQLRRNIREEEERQAKKPDFIPFTPWVRLKSLWNRLRYGK